MKQVSVNDQLVETWNLDSIFPGGSASVEFAKFLDELGRNLAELYSALKQASVPRNIDETRALDQTIEGLQSARARLLEAGAFVECLTAQDQHDKKAVQLTGKVTSLRAALQNVMTLFESLLRDTEDQVWLEWIARDEIAPIAFVMNEKRDSAREKLSPELESLAADLAVDGYHGWGQHYDTIVAKVGVEFTDDEGKKSTLSVGQAANKLSDSDRDVRERTFVEWEKAWGDVADYSADTLNRLAGFRLKLYEKRGWEDALKEPLQINRMSRETLDMMWQVIEENKPIFVSYLERKAKMLGVEQLSWGDVDAPLAKSETKIGYQAAAEDIVKQFGKFSPKMADFAADAFNRGWIEAEDRPGKRPGGFCTSLPVSKQTRIFMTFGGNYSNVSTLAHELGHAYHQYLMEELPQFNQDYAMNVAETASTFAEMILADALLKNAGSEEEKLALLAEKVQNSVSFFMNIHARFLFETRFYEKRKSGMLDASELSALMEEAQREAYHGALGNYHPLFWTSKLHFYITDVPFYNFPYTFGYMFSTGIYAQALKEGEGFAEKYDAILRDTGRMTVEELASKHLNADLTKPDFWRDAMALAVADAQMFLDMTK
ncbi:M3 family oligoendopeptidase [Paenibacillus lutimineralis]|uniref:M3 family oligoendopeptidase n=1 Tax=Paenibacillus lutimineralis TaxID=2707005 RepID=A0A3Q9IBQ8_9BACL|nr:M3 family oligoendopeptidase [Paenibacillus lutimineralis]AZS17193.1 M3 family oligoendopeptidase [Paenibacillus lutimineralis]